MSNLSCHWHINSEIINLLAQRAWRAVVFGDKGQAGKELVKLLLESQNWKTVSVVLPKKDHFWEDLPQTHSKLDLDICDDWNSLFTIPKWDRFMVYNGAFCTIESFMAEWKGAEDVEHDYTLQIAKIVNCCKIPYFGLLLGMSSDPKSVAYYLKQLGENERNIVALAIKYISIFKPGMLLHNAGEQTIAESVVKKTPLLPTMEAKDIAKAMFIDAELRLGGQNEKIESKLHIKEKGIKEMLNLS